MKVIETRYKNHKFRSRLEARYAVFFDTVPVQWLYEDEGYDLDGELYLPDFWLPTVEMSVEVKGKMPTQQEIRLCRKLQFHTGHDVMLCYGLPGENNGLLFGWTDENGGYPVEIQADWSHVFDADAIYCGIIRAKEARFEHEASTRYRSGIDYGNLPF